MAKKKKHEEHENHERWLVSYADFITLLFAFFVVMYAVSSVNEGKYRTLSESLVSAFSNKKPLGQMSLVPLPLSQKRAVLDREIQKTPNDFQMYMKVANSLAAFSADSNITVQNSHRGVSIRIKDDVLFDSGSATLKSEVKDVLDLIAALVKDLPNLISVDGHTDSVPIHTKAFPSNWELSSMRATTLVRYFIDTHQIAPERLSATGFAGERPIASNETPEGRNANRRVEIVILRETSTPMLQPQSRLTGS